MVDFARRSDAEIMRAHQKVQAARPAPRPASPPRNVRHLIDIGNDRVMLYRRTVPLRIPPVPALVGIEVLELRQRLEQEQDLRTRAALLVRLTRVAESCVRPVGRWRRTKRLLQRLGLWHPFRDISEGELAGTADFLSRCRQSASILAH